MVSALELRPPSPEETEGVEEEQDYLPALMDKVFGIELILEKILGYAIQDDTGQLCRSSASSLRLVQKSWLETITRLFYKSRKSLLCFAPKFIARYDFFSDTALAKKTLPESLDQFVSNLASCTSTLVPPFSIHLPPNAFRRENHKNISKLLVNHGASLICLGMRIPNNGVAFLLQFRYKFPSFALPNLRKVTLDLPPPSGSKWKQNFPSGYSGSVSNFIKSLLSSAPALPHLRVHCYNPPILDVNPLQFQRFILPPTVTTLDLSCDNMTSDHLQMLIRNSLPLLISLTLRIPMKKGYQAGLLFRVLDSVRGSLRKLKLEGVALYTEPPLVISSLRFPLMEHLEEFSTSSINCELEPQSTALEKCLPKLSRLTLTRQTYEMVEQWTHGSKLRSVEQLTVHLADEYTEGDFREAELGVDLEITRDLHSTFPNVRDLDVTLNPRHVEGLQYIFAEMGQLTALTVKVVGDARGLDWNFWDGLLIGVPPESVTFLRAFPDRWLKSEGANARHPSIRNLRELTSFSLDINPRSCTYDYDAANPMISDLTFDFALCVMPKLTDLLLTNKIMASEKMAKIWRGQGRRLVHHRR